MTLFNIKSRIGSCWNFVCENFFFVIFVMFVFAAWCLLPTIIGKMLGIYHLGQTDLQSYGQYGDMYGCLNCLISGIALIYLGKSVRLQGQELRDQSKEHQKELEQQKMLCLCKEIPVVETVLNGVVIYPIAETGDGHDYLLVWDFSRGGSSMINPLFSVHVTDDWKKDLGICTCRPGRLPNPECKKHEVCFILKCPRPIVGSSRVVVTALFQNDQGGCFEHVESYKVVFDDESNQTSKLAFEDVSEILGNLCYDRSSVDKSLEGIMRKKQKIANQLTCISTNDPIKNGPIVESLYNLEVVDLQRYYDSRTLCQGVVETKEEFQEEE